MPASHQSASAKAAGAAGAGQPVELLGDVGPALLSALRDLGPDDKDERGSLRPPEMLRAGYWGALNLLSQSKLERACEDLVRLEAPASRSARPDSMDVLDSAELAVARRLAEIDGGSVYPLVTMHEELAREYLRTGHERLIGHAIRIAGELATLFVSTAHEGAARELAAGALATLGAGLAEQGAVIDLQNVLHEALAIDPDSQSALLLLAVHLETHGRPDEAVPFLKRLLAAHPGCREGALHLAVCLRRTGEVVPAGLLESCLDPAAPDWLRAVAYDELARQALDRGDWRQAIAVLSRGVQERPDLPGLRIELAYAYDRAGRPADSSGVIDDLVAAAAQAGTSPRLSYGQPVPQTVKLERGRIAESTGLHLAALAGALARTAAPPER